MRAIGLWTALAGLALLAGAARADEGLWTFDNFPAAKVKAAYGIDITPAWLARVQAAAVRLSVGCSASEVSAAGLVLTNDHCVSDCVQAFSTPDNDVPKTGFLAATLPEERSCPQMEADVLLQVTDVTARMTAAGGGFAGEALVKARDAASASLAQAACGADPRLQCQVVSLYHGGQYRLYKYHRYADVRLVFSPGDQAAFFGGDPDNFNFPRFDLDCAFLRLYEDGKPVATPGHLRFRPRPPVAGEPVFAAGDPGGAFRADTLAQLETQRDAILPIQLAQLAELRGRMIRFGEESADNARRIDEPLMDLENDFKVVSGRLTALDDTAFMAAKRAEEDEIKARAMTKLGASFGDPWADLARVQAALAALYIPYRQLDGGPIDSALFDDARGLVRAAAERELPSAQRLAGYADSQLPGLEKQLLDPQPIQPAFEQLALEFWLSKSRELLTADDPATRLLLGNESPEALSARLVTGAKLGDPAVRKALWDGGMAAIAASDDPMIRFMVRMDPAARRVRAAYEDQVTGPTTRATAAIARARFMVLGDSAYPDGTFTLRLSYGAVAGWTWRGKTVPPFTTFAGLYQRATGAPPFDLDPRWVVARPKLDPNMIFNLSTTDDIIGGNSGSPLLDARGEVIGALFDGNSLGLGGDYGYDGGVNRAVALSAQAIDVALRKVYGADALARELAAE
jgi:hypothetical protein